MERYQLYANFINQRSVKCSHLQMYMLFISFSGSLDFVVFFWFPLPELNYLSGKGKGKTKQNKQKELTGSPRNLVNESERYSVLYLSDFLAVITAAHVR